MFGLKKYNMAKFLQTKLPIWTFYTTSGGNAECEVEVVQTITQKSAALMRYFYDGSKKVASPQLGTFDQRHKDYMTVRTPGGYYLQERIVYAKHDYSCAVIEVTMKLCGHKHIYDLLVSNSSIKTGPHHKCIKQYRKRESKGRRVYHPYCQDILKNRGSFQNQSTKVERCLR
uniref:Putative group i salivary lipocalin lipocalin n=1 Tax=Rhipicephalus microplus TaxID=6941 RepID=A0A6G5A3I4_RHIMP